LLERLEWQDAETGDAWGWDLDGWLGGDFERLWLRSQGEREDGSTRDADLELFYGRAYSRWWEFVAGARQDFGSGPSRTWAALGVQGVAPFMVHVEATGYVGESGRTALRLEARQDLRLLQRVILQPVLEADLYGKDDPEAGTGSGLSVLEAGLRLRFEIRREFAPYLGLTWQRRYGGTADLARAAGEEVEDTRLVAGVRAWF
jgi:copper resistance protein B